MRAAIVIVAAAGLLACGTSSGNPDYDGPHLVMPRQLTITEGASTTFTAGLDVGESSFAEAAIVSNELTLTPASIALSSSMRSQDFTITAAVDTDTMDVDPAWVTFDVAGTIAGESPTLRMRIVDIDRQNYLASTWNLTVPANGSATCDVRLTQWPNDPNSINDPRIVGVVAIGDNASHVVVSPTRLTFGSGNYNIPQTITVSRVDDTFFEQTLILLQSSNGFWDATISVVPPYSELH